MSCRGPAVWESGAIPETRDPFGLPLTTTPDAAAAYAAGLGRVLRVQSGAEALLREAVEIDPDFALGHAALALLGTEWSVDVDVPAALYAAQRSASRADEREQRFVDVATARVRAPGPESSAALLSYINSCPEDALAVSVAVPTIAFAGATEVPAEAWALVEDIAPAYGDHWWHRGLLAFVRQEQEDWDSAARLAQLSLAAEPAAGHAVHARTHVHYETGDHEAGLRWLDEWITGCGARASHRAHFSWHAALHELALDRDRDACARYTTQLAPPAVTGVRALIDSAALLWRGYVCDAWSEVDAAPVLDTVPPALLADPPTPFIGLHAAIALATAGDDAGLARLGRRLAAGSDPVLAHTVAPLADALADLLHGHPDRALDLLTALPDVDRLGGSAAQREVVQETVIWCATRAGRTELARSLLTERLDRRASPRDARRSAALVG